jgi:hypothetical protein
MNPVHTELSELVIGAGKAFRNLSVFALFRSCIASLDGPEYILLDDAIAEGTARVTELHASGSVPELRFENLGQRPVFLLDGQELIGAKQNRVLNLTILAPAKSTIVIPVSCVEAGRWHRTGADFSAIDQVMYARVRAARTAQVTRSMHSDGLRRSDQSAVWADIAAKANYLDATSPTSAMSAIYERKSLAVEEYARSFSWQDRQCGVVFTIGTSAAGLDLFDHSQTMQRYFSRLIRSYALDALDSPKGEPADLSQASALVERIASSQSIAEPAVGMGKDVRLTSQGISGAALWAEGRYVHLCAFTSNDETGFSSKVSRPSRRWR